MLKLLRCFLVVDIMRGFSTQNKPLIGIEALVQLQAQPIMQREFEKEYKEALQYSVLSAKQKELQRLLIDHPVILEDEQLEQMLLLKLKIEANNYHSYY
jgi:hypothetical protein